MPSHRLSALFDPQSVAVVGASSVAASVGGALWRAIGPGADEGDTQTHSFAGRAYAVNPKYAWIGETPCYRRLTDLPEPVDLALIAIPADAVAEVIRDCGRAGCRFAVVFSRTDHETLSTEALLRVAREAKVRLIGPAARGVVRSLSRLDATAHEGSPVGGRADMPGTPGERIALEPGSISVLSQSGAWLSVLRDFARGSSIRFASLMATGEAADLDVGELLDYFAFDPATREVLTYAEDIRDAAAFMSSVRQLARMKPVVIMKAGHADRYRLPDGTQATALLRHDRVVDAAIRRAGAVRAQTVVHMVGTARLLAGQGQRTYRRVAVLTNGRGPGVVALDAIAARGLARAPLSDETVLALRRSLPVYASVANPVDVAGDADETRVERALGILLADPEVDCVLMLYAPQPLLAPEALARILCRTAEASPKAIVAVLGGGASVIHARRQLDEARVAQFLTIENALDAMATMDSFATHQAILREVPPRQSVDGGVEGAPDRDRAQRVLDAARSAGRSVLLPQEASALLAAYGIPVAASSSLERPGAAVAAAERVGYPVRLSAVTTGIDTAVPLREHGLETPDEVRRAWRRLRSRATRSHGAGGQMQVTLEAEHRSAATRELFVGLANDPVFGCVLAVGAGGPAVAQIDDIALELPPVNRVLIRHWLARTRVSRLLDALGDLPAANVESLIELLERFSALACACPEVIACDLNPVLVDEDGALVGAARIVLRSPGEADALRRGRPYAHLAIHPYPAELTERVTLRTGACVLVRAIRPDDAVLEQAFVAALAPQTRYFRFMMNVRELTPAMIERFTQIDYRHELALIALEGEGASERMCAVARITPSGAHEECEFAIVVGEWMQGSGLGRMLMHRLMAAAAERCYRSIYGLVLAENVRMLGFCESLGFTATVDTEDPALVVVRRAL
jgi:acetyltransferase